MKNQKRFINQLSEVELHEFEQLPPELKKEVLLGHKVSVVGLDGNSICEFNKDSPFIPKKHEAEALARSLLPSIQEFYAKEENQKEFEAWQAERKKSKK